MLGLHSCTTNMSKISCGAADQTQDFLQTPTEQHTQALNQIWILILPILNRVALGSEATIQSPHFLYQENRDHLDRALSIINNSRRTVLNAMAIAMDTHLSELNMWVISHHLGPHRAPFTICHVHFTHEQRKAAVCTNTSRTVTISNVTHGKSLTSPHCT